MTNYEKQINMTIEEMAEFNVKAIPINCGYYQYYDYLTSGGTTYSKLENAIEYEIDWLNSEVE